MKAISNVSFFYVYNYVSSNIVKTVYLDDIITGIITKKKTFKCLFIIVNVKKIIVYNIFKIYIIIVQKPIFK